MGEPVSAQMNNILDLEKEEVKEVTERSIKEVADESVQQLKATSPKAKGKYARGWRKKVDGDGVVIHNATDWQLTHLLNNGHEIYNRFGGSFGRVNGDNHIGEVEKWANNELPLRISRGLK